ncbi:MAG: DUF484 family protein [Ectothiorhodospiraceae bacterium]|nr:DUF484 family protein [Chromatiales bacterium]MCP5155014.1 DUF484 family protein [Ectothiorhodospiraceae bacterium]
MSAPDLPASQDGPDAEAAVIAYLRADPELFARHPELLEVLRLPHERGGVVSLAEYQASQLRERNEELRRRLAELVRNARDNEDLGQRVHRLTLGLIECERLDDVFARLYAGLLEDFQADLAAIRLLVPAPSPEQAALGEFAVDPELGRRLFSVALAAGKPTCGRPSADQAAYLFAGRAEEVGSAAIIPLGAIDRVGLLAICSRDPQRYHAGMGTVFLRQLGEVVSAVVAPFLRAP